MEQRISKQAAYTSPSTFIKLAISLATGLCIIGLTALLFPVSNEDLQLVLTNLSNNLPLALLATSLFILGFTLRALRWSIAIAPEAPRLLYISGYGWTQLWLNILPLRLGEGARPAWAWRQGHSANTAIAASILERTFDASILIFLFVLGILISGKNLPISEELDHRVLYSIAILMGILGLFCLYYLKPKQHGLSKSPGNSHRVVRYFFILSIAAWAAHILGIYVSCQVMGFEVDLVFAAVLLATVNLSGILTIAPANMGTFEAAGVVVFYLWGYAENSELTACITIHALTFSSLMLFSTASWFYLRRKQKLI